MPVLTEQILYKHTEHLPAVISRTFSFLVPAVSSSPFASVFGLAGVVMLVLVFLLL